MSQDRSSGTSNDRSEGTSRRRFISCSVLAALAAALEPVAELVVDRGWYRVAKAEGPDPGSLVRDTMNGMVAFVVPGPDEYSVHQGVSTSEPGGIAANIVDLLMTSIDWSQPAPPLLPSFSTLVAVVLNTMARSVNPMPSGPFPSAFARLSFEEKVQVFAAMEATPALQPLAALLPAYVAFFAYSEAGVFDPATRTLSEQPVGWSLTGYQFAHGHDEFKGYYRNRRRVLRQDDGKGRR